MPVLRIDLQDNFLISPRGVWRLESRKRKPVKDSVGEFNQSSKGFDHFLRPFKLDGNPRIPCRDVQEWLLNHVGYQVFARNDHDRYYYPDETLPPVLNGGRLVKDPRPLEKDERRWGKKSVNSPTGKFERLISFNVSDAEIAAEFMMRFGKSMRQIDSLNLGV